jgi:Flp pilus assembly protein TadG
MNRGARGRDSGSAAIELAVIAPAIIAVFVMLLIAGRTVIAKQSIEAAAFDAARTASLSRDASTALAQARAAALDTLAAQGLNCSSVEVRVDVAEFARPVGEPASVTAVVECVVNFRDVALSGMPGQTTLTATFTSPLDTYRSRS